MYYKTFEQFRKELVLGIKKEMVKVLRKLGWAGQSWTPKEFASQIKNLDDQTLKNWASSSKVIPNTPLAFQQKLVGIELKKRGLSDKPINKEFGFMG